MKRDFLALLACPECKGELSMFDAVEEAGEIKTAKLACKNGHGYPVRDFVPRFVPADAYVSSFSFEWTTHQTTQLDSVTKREPKDPESSDAIFRAKTGFKPGKLSGKLVLDGGVAAIPLRLKKLERFLEAEPLSVARQAEALTLLQGEIEPLSDLRGSAEYRRQLVHNLTRRFLAEVGG
jgi:uncharacterized protein YbaR (Trm112 family)